MRLSLFWTRHLHSTPKWRQRSRTSCKLKQDKTVIAIAHHLSTIAMMDRLIVIDGGKVAEQGSHAELLGTNGIFAELWRRQTNGFLVPETDEVP